jgi:hypothetical protein
MIDGGKIPTEATAPIWITNSGLESSRAKLSFDELLEMLLNMQRLAEKLSNFGSSSSKPQPAPTGQPASAAAGDKKH